MLQISEIRSAVIPIARDYGVKRLYLFGSYKKEVLRILSLKKKLCSERWSKAGGGYL